MSSIKLTILKLLRWTVTLFFLVAGTTKLLALNDMTVLFDHFQLPLWFMYLTGIIEVLSAIGLLLWNQKIGLMAALTLFMTMLVAGIFHLIYDSLIQSVPAISLAILFAFWVAKQYAHLNLNRKGEM